VNLAVIEPDVHAASPAASPFALPWAGCDDGALLAHLRGPRPVQIDLVVDAEECAPERLAALLQGRFEFNGESHDLGRQPDWLHNPSADVEWHILLHKFYYAAGLARDFRASGDQRLVQRWVELLDGWMARVPPGFIAADVTGRRVQNWIYSLRGFVFHDAVDGPAPAAALDPAFVRRLLVSIEQQVEYLCAHLTPKRNHRTLELYAIFLAGVALPELARAPHWRRFALEQTVVNMQADLLADGVHCELSTDYHHLALRNWLHVRTLAVRNGVPLPPAMDRLLEKALEFSLHVHKPDGVVPSLSDGDARDWRALLAQGADLYRREDMRWVASAGARGRAPDKLLAHFADSGYSVLRSSWGRGAADFADAQYLVFDSGPLGEGNHGHLDCLSFELAAHGRSLIVDPGRYTYSEAGNVNWRVHFRGTAAHNTVCVDGRQQTRYAPKAVKEASRHAPGSLRHRIGGPAPEATLLEGAWAPGCALLHGRALSHEYDARHERVIALLGGALWIVSDHLDASSEHEYALSFQLAAEAQGASDLRIDDAVRLTCPGLALLQLRSPGLEARLEPGWVSRRYGHKAPAPRLRSVQRAINTRFDSVLLPWRDQAPRLKARPVTIEAPAGSAAALLIESGTGAQAQRHLWWHDRQPRHWRWAGFDFQGRWLHLQWDAEGSLQAAHASAGAALQRDGRSLALTIPQPVQQP
jgi:hypothetical protein